MGQALEDRDVGDGRQQAAGQDDLLATDAVGQPAEEDEERRAQCQRSGDQQVGGGGIDLQHAAEEEQRVELAAVPDHRLASRRTEQDQQHQLQVATLQAVAERGLGALAFSLHLLEQRRFAQLQADPYRNAQQQDRDQERDAPAPGFEGLVAQRHAAGQDDQQRQEQAERGGALDEAGVQAALVVRRVLGHVGGGTAVLAAHRQALGQAQDDQDHRCGETDRGVVGQHADQEGRDAHDQDGDQEGVLAADAVAEAAEEGRAERTHEEAGSERQQGEDHARGFIDATEELLGDDGRERAVQEEVIPLEDRAEARGEDDFLVALGQGARRMVRAWCSAGHKTLPLRSNRCGWVPTVGRHSIR